MVKSKTPLWDKLKQIQKEDAPDYQHMIAEFLENPRLSYSALKHFVTSPWDFIQYKIGDKKSSKAFDTGNVFELMLLQPELVDSTIVEMPVFSGTGSRAAKAEFLADNVGKLCVTAQEIDNCFQMYQRAINHEDVQMFLEGKASVQDEIYWTDRETGLRSLSKLDMRSDYYDRVPWICDLKTSQSAERSKFQKSIWNFDYGLQAGGYTLAIERTKFVYPDYYWLVVETSEPFGINKFRCDPSLLHEFKRFYLQVLQAFKYCIDHNLWHQSHSFWRFMTPYESVQRTGWYKPKI
jgi:hypothetical protein